MGQKVNPHGLRVGVIKDWDSKWIAGKKDFGNQLVEDYNIRKFVKKACYDAGIAKIVIERKQNKVFVNIHAAKPGIIIGRQGAEIDKLKKQIEKLTKDSVNINILEV
ncbi:MAG: 30S ribosomal protein S3, partial [Clostridia bacterium]|nr:30S ribosomal protein S3 [Clostridia bacterium]